MSITLDTIMGRSSVRTFAEGPLSAEDRDAIGRTLAARDASPFGTDIRLALADADGDGTGAIGTYGMIRSAPAFVLGCMRPAPLAFVDFGYVFEGLVLEATALGLGTCWLGGTFNRAKARLALGLAEGEIVPSITPIGRPAARRSIAESLVRAGAGADRRKPWASLFFDGGWTRPLTEAEAGPWDRVLSAVRAGPSASNKQPWRVVRTGGAAAPSFHLYLDEDRAYNSALPGIRIQELDMGIAMRHFEAASRALGLPGSWRRLDAAPLAAEPPLSYVASWTA